MSDLATPIDHIAEAQIDKEETANAFMDAAAWAATFAMRDVTTSGLTWGYYGGRLGGILIANDDLTLTASATNYIVVNRSTMVASVSTSGTNWADTTTYGRAYIVTTDASGPTDWEDCRADEGGILEPSGAGGSGSGGTTIPQNSKSAAYTTVLSDAGKHLYHPGADTTARTWTIDSNANVAYPVGTPITFVNDTSGGVITIAITSDTLVLAGAGTTGSRTLAANGVATALKITSTRWIISGTGLT